MNARIHVGKPLVGYPAALLVLAALMLVVSVGCSPASAQPIESPAPGATEHPDAPATPLATAVSEVMVPAGWSTYSSQQCEYEVSYPQNMEVSKDGTYSRTLGIKLDNPEQGIPNFIYISVIPQDYQNLGDEWIYNYDPDEAEKLLNMPVGESGSVREDLNVAEWFTYQRLPDTLISDYTAQAYENNSPWEFPGGTKEIRYYMQFDGCTYLIGSYLDTTGSDQPGAINEDLFNQIMGTMQLIP